MPFEEIYLNSFIRIRIPLCAHLKAFAWNPEKTCKYLQLTDFDLTATSTTSSHSFKTALGTIQLMTGYRYYFEVKITKGTNFKIGVSRPDCNLDLAFSDTAKGWAYYSSGYLRHNSGGDGPSYGEVFKENDIVGTYVDMIDGILFFSKNGKVFDKAYQEKEFMEGELYPACCCLSNLEGFRLLSPQPED